MEFRVTNASKRTAEYTVDGQRHSVNPGATRFHTVCTTVDVSFPAGVPSGAGIEQREKGRTIRPSAGDNLVVRGEARPTVRVER